MGHFFALPVVLRGTRGVFCTTPPGHETGLQRVAGVASPAPWFSCLPWAYHSPVLPSTLATTCKVSVFFDRQLQSVCFKHRRAPWACRCTPFFVCALFALFVFATSLPLQRTWGGTSLTTNKTALQDHLGRDNLDLAPNDLHGHHLTTHLGFAFRVKLH